MVAFGKHAGRTYKFVYQNDPQYCQWVVTTHQLELQEADGGQLSQFSRFATWIQEAEILMAETGVMEIMSCSEESVGSDGTDVL